MQENKGQIIKIMRENMASMVDREWSFFVFCFFVELPLDKIIGYL